MKVAAGSVQAWLLCARPKTLSAAFVPVMVGTAVVHCVGQIAWSPALAALFSALCLQIGTNFANDVFDYKRGADNEHRIGPTRAAQAGLLRPQAILRGMWLLFALASLFGSYLVWRAGWPLVVVGVASISSGIAYTGGPYPLGYNGLGDLFVLVFFGFVAVCGTVYVQLLAIPTLALWAALPVGSLATAILVVNNLRDIDTDAKAGKKTLAVRWGRSAARAEYLFLLLVSFALPAFLWARGDAAWILLPWLSAPLAVHSTIAVYQRRGPPLNQTLQATALLLLVFGSLWAAGMVLSRG